MATIQNSTIVNNTGGIEVNSNADSLNIDSTILSGNAPITNTFDLKAPA